MYRAVRCLFFRSLWICYFIVVNFFIMEDVKLIINGKELEIKKIFLAHERNGLIIYHIYIDKNALVKKEQKQLKL